MSSNYSINRKWSRDREAEKDGDREKQRQRWRDTKTEKQTNLLALTYSSQIVHKRHTQTMKQSSQFKFSWETATPIDHCMNYYFNIYYLDLTTCLIVILNLYKPVFSCTGYRIALNLLHICSGNSQVWWLSLCLKVYSYHVWENYKTKLDFQMLRTVFVIARFCTILTKLLFI